MVIDTQAPPPKLIAPKHYEYIDALRGIAFLMVLVVHSVDVLTHSSHLLPALPERFDKLAGDGRMGVQLFFVISAFTLASSFYARKRQESHPTIDFFIRRLFRIAPMFWAAILLYTNLDEVRYFNQKAFAPEGVHWWHIATTASFLHAWYPTTFNSVVPGGWSVGVEMSFYVLVPLLLRLITSYDRALWYTFGALIGSLVVNALMTRFVAPAWTNDFSHPFDVLTTYWLPAQLPVFLLGFVLFFLFKNEEEHNPQHSKKLPSLFLLATSLYLMAFATDLQPNIFLPPYFIFGVAFALLAWSLHLFPWRLFVNPVSVYVGKISYSCYLTHFFYSLCPRISFSAKVPSLYRTERVVISTFILLVFACGNRFREYDHVSFYRNTRYAYRETIDRSP